MTDKALPRRPHGGGGAAADSPYALQDLMRDVPLSNVEDGDRSYITCVDFWGMSKAFRSHGTGRLTFGRW